MLLFQLIPGEHKISSMDKNPYQNSRTKKGDNLKT